MKGIILAGGLGTRLYPVTKVVCKNLLPVYKKPLIHYPMAALVQAGIRDVLIISTKQALSDFYELFGNGYHLGMNIEYAEEKVPKGIAQAFMIGEEFIGDDDVCLVLGDNIFYGAGFSDMLESAKVKVQNKKNAVIFGYYVNDPRRYGIIEFNDKGRVLSIEEKPAEPKSNYAAVGLYFYPNDVIEVAKNLKPSGRGELEITDVNKEYLKRDKLDVEVMDKEYTWFDAGTFDSLLDAAEFIRYMKRKQQTDIADIESFAINNGWIKHDYTMKHERLNSKYKSSMKD